MSEARERLRIRNGLGSFGKGERKALVQSCLFHASAALLLSIVTNIQHVKIGEGVSSSLLGLKCEYVMKRKAYKILDIHLP